MTIDKSVVYTSYRDLVIHSENISWSRFGNFLIISSILVLAWATLYKVCPRDLPLNIVMTAIYAIGILAGVAWSDLGNRGRIYLDQYKAKAKAIEKHAYKQDWWKQGIPITDRPFQIQLKPKFYSSSTILLIMIPLLFSLLHLFLLVITWIK